MKREDGKFKKNEGGISSMLFHHAALIIHGKGKVTLFFRFKGSAYSRIAANRV